MNNSKCTSRMRHGVPAPPPAGNYKIAENKRIALIMQVKSMNEYSSHTPIISVVKDILCDV